jgi:hypothetical protein
MGNSLSHLKRSILPQAIDDLKARKSLYKNGPHWKAAVRNPAYCIMSWPGGSLPQNTVPWTATYQKGRHRKPSPSLKSVELAFNAPEGNALVIQAKFVIKIFTKDDFDEIVNTLCKQGTLLTFSWGYDVPYGTGNNGNGGYSGRSLSGCKLATTAFNTEPDGTYIIEGVASGPSLAVGALNANYQIKPGDRPREYLNDGQRYPVTGIVELLTYWAQGNGKKSIDKMEDGDVLIVPSGRKSDGTAQNMGSIMIFDSKHLEQSGVSAWVGRQIASLQKTNNELNSTNNIIYISLETLIGLFNTEVLPMYTTTTTSVPRSQDFSKLKLEFDPLLSFSYIDTSIRSAYPTRVLIMGSMHGDYKNNKGKGKNFWEDAKNKSAVNSIAGNDGTRTKIDLKKIFIERSIILAALDSTAEDKGGASTIDPRVHRDASINIREFFNKIFQEIKASTGDRISLTLSMHPDVFDANDDKAYNLYVFDETNGYDPPPKDVWEFDPVDGDGITRSFSIKGEMGSGNYQLSQFNGPSTTNDAMAKADGIKPLVDASRAVSRAKAITDIDNIIKKKGQLGDSAFDEVHMQALKSAFVTLKDSEPKKEIYNNLVFIGLGCDVELDGIWGIGPGAGIWSTQMPKRYKDNQVYFSVMSTTHRFDGDTSDWSTLLTGYLISHEKVEYLK